MSEIKIIDTNNDNILKYGICGYKNIKRAGFPEKTRWMKDAKKNSGPVENLANDY